MTKPYSFWGVADVGFTTDAWSGFPGISVNKLQLFFPPLENTELVINFPFLVVSPATVRSFATAGGPPPPPAS